MKPAHLFIAVAIIGGGALFYLLFSDSSEAYVVEIEKYRNEREDYMMNSAASPFIEAGLEFNGLNYYPPNEKFRIVADLTFIEKPETRHLATSDGNKQTYITFAWASFDFDNRKNRLLILESLDPGPAKGTLFLAFGDGTSGDGTYGGGRYLDLTSIPRGSQTIELDFNKAYNPYCAYVPDYSCPLPPPENLLEVSITAGEMNYY